MTRRLKRLLFRLLQPAWTLLGAVVPKDSGAVAINTFPDYDDSTRALAATLRSTRHKLFVLTTKRGARKPTWVDDARVITAYRYSLKGVWLYHRARFILFTHGCFSAWRPGGRQVVVNIWHGMPLKRIGLLDGKTQDELPQFHYTIASDSRFQAIMSSAFGVPKDRVLIAEHPRIDMLRRDSSRVHSVFPAHDKLVVWLPTYRASVVGDVRVDGEASADVVGGGIDLEMLDTVCTQLRIVCIVKPHPMARVDRHSFRKFKSVMIIDDDGLAERKLSLYEVLAASDMLITDVSSVYFDYKTLGRPIILYCPDLEQYTATRGFVAPIETLVSDAIIKSQELLFDRLANWCREDCDIPATVNVKSGAATNNLLRQIGML